MRHVIGLVLTTTGAFFLAGGVLMKTYVTPRLAQAPTTIYSVTTLRDQDAAYLDPSTGRLRIGATVTVTTTVRGDPQAGHGRIAVWDSFVATEDVPAGAPIQYARYRVAFDRRTAELTGCCGANVDGDTEAPFAGIGMYWPMNVAKRAHLLFDFPTRRAWPIHFDGEQVVQGMRTYRFVQHVPDTTLPGPTPEVPGSLLGRGERSGTVAVDRRYRADNTYWIDPRSGATVNTRQRLTTTLVPKAGPGRLVVADLDLRMPQDQQRLIVAKARAGDHSLWLLTTALPIGGLAAGAALLLPGVLLAGRPERADPCGQEEPEAVTAPI